MNPDPGPDTMIKTRLRFWSRWLSGCAMAVAAFGLLLVLAPALALMGFSLMVYGDPARLAGFGPEAQRYVALSHAVMGALMTGWGVLLLGMARNWLPQDPRRVARWMGLSLLAWWLPDTAYSLASGFWQNAVLNLGFGALFAIGLAGVRRATA